MMKMRLLIVLIIAMVATFNLGNVNAKKTTPSEEQPVAQQVMLLSEVSIEKAREHKDAIKDGAIAAALKVPSDHVQIIDIKKFSEDETELVYSVKAASTAGQNALCRKMTTNELGDYQIPTLYDVSGSADFRNQTHDGFSIYRHYRDKEIDGDNIYKNQVQFFVEKIKMKFQGEMTKSETFNYDLPSGRYYVGNERPTFVFDQEDEPMVVKPKNIEEAFDTNELPF